MRKTIAIDRLNLFASAGGTAYVGLLWVGTPLPDVLMSRSWLLGNDKIVLIGIMDQFPC